MQAFRNAIKGADTHNSFYEGNSEEKTKQNRLYNSLPFGKVTMFGKEYTHFNTVDSVLDS